MFGKEIYVNLNYIDRYAHLYDIIT